MSDKIYKTGIYARLSREDADRMESNSIQSQRAICLAYIESHEDLELVDTYIDDGETGSNTDRPGFQRMLQDMRSGRIDCAVSKDLSRFSRNYGASDLISYSQGRKNVVKCREETAGWRKHETADIE